MNDAPATEPAEDPTAAMEETPAKAPGPAGRAVAGWAAVVLLLVGLGVFIAPFAFPIRPPVVQGIRSTVLFSPGSGGAHATALVSFRMNEAGSAAVSVSDPSDRGGTLRKVIRQGAAPAGRLTVRWDGRDETGRRLPDGRYIINIKARADSRSWNSNRPIYIDTSAPRPRSVVVRSAIGLGARGACDVAVTADEAATVRMDIRRAPGTGSAIVTRDAAPIAAGATARWTWDGTGRGARVATGLYVVRVVMADRLDNESTTVRTCWVGHGGGTAIPARPQRGDAVRVRLSDRAGRTLSPSTPVTLSLAVRRGDLGGSRLDVVGPAVGAATRGPVGRAQLLLPRRRALDTLWLIATTSDQRVVIPLRP